MYCIGRGQSQFCETSAKVTDGLTDPLRWLCQALSEVCGERERILTSFQ